MTPSQLEHAHRAIASARERIKILDERRGLVNAWYQGVVRVQAIAGFVQKGLEMIETFVVQERGDLVDTIARAQDALSREKPPKPPAPNGAEKAVQ